MAAGAEEAIRRQTGAGRLRTDELGGPVANMEPRALTDCLDGSSTDRPRKKKRAVVNRQKDRPGQFLKLRGVLDQPTLWEHAATIPPKSCEGAPRKLPDIAYLSMPSLAAIWGSFSKAETALNEAEVWEIYCRSLCDMQKRYRPQDDSFDLDRLLATAPLTAQNFFDARRSWLAPHLESLEATFAKHAAVAALEVGYADPSCPGSYNDLTRPRTLVGDGKVTREPGSRYATLPKSAEKRSAGITAETHVVDKTTGEIIAAADMKGDAHLYITGSGPAVGFKTVRLSLRTPSRPAARKRTVRDGARLAPNHRERQQPVRHSKGPTTGPQLAPGLEPRQRDRLGPRPERRRAPARPTAPRCRRGTGPPRSRRRRSGLTQPLKPALRMSPAG